MVYLLQILLPLFVFAGIVFTSDFRAMTNVGRMQLFIGLMIGVAVLEVAIIVASRVLLHRLAIQRIRVSSNIKRIAGRDTSIVAAKDIARVIVTETPSGNTRSIQLRSFGGNMVLWGLEDMDDLREAIETKIPDRRGRVQVKSLRFDMDSPLRLAAIIVGMATIALLGRALVNFIWLGLDLGGFVVITLGVLLLSKPLIRLKNRWAGEIEMLCGGLLAIVGVVLLLFDWLT